jgi:signal transduction histidine kinase
MDIEDENDGKPTRLHEAFAQLWESDEDEELGDLDNLTVRIQEILKGNRGNVSNSKKLEDCFNSYDKKKKEDEEKRELARLEGFISTEQALGRQRRSEARKLEAIEEMRLAVEIAQLKGVRMRQQLATTHEEVQLKISDAEQSFLRRKMVFAKAAQVASAECRLQFARVREFYDKLHNTRQEVLRRQHRRTLQFQEITHRLCGTDARVVSLDQQITNRLYQKKKADLNEVHMAQTLEEAVYLESMMDVLDSVQSGKETAARELFELHIRNIKAQREANAKREDNRALLMASATLEMAKLVARYTEEDREDKENEVELGEKVDAVERRKDFDASSVSQLYDTVLWSVASSQLGLARSSMYSSDQENDDDDEGEDEESNGNAEPADNDVFPSKKDGDHFSDTGFTADLTAGDKEELQKLLTPAGNMHVYHLTKEIHSGEKALIKQHSDEVKRERRHHREAAQTLRKKHQTNVDSLLERSFVERQNLRDATSQRMNALVGRQEASTEQMRKNDVRLMQEALRAEDRRLADAETSSFAKAQKLISAQVFHEVRNALSSVIAISEMTLSMKKDTALSPVDLVSSVDDMLDQIKDVVHYALKMLNDILDVSKMNSGVFQAHSKPFDLQDLVTRATRMQLAKAGRVKMSFIPASQPYIAVSDCDLIERIIANMISNAVKFTSSGAVQPFICPVEDLLADANGASAEGGSHSGGDPPVGTDAQLLLQTSIAENSQLQLDNSKMKMVAVGVADTGPGLSEGALRSAESGISTSDSKTTAHGAHNTGFGLFHAHLQAKALNTKLYLSTPIQCRNMLNGDMLDAMAEYQGSSEDMTAAGPIITDRAPGKGTIIYLTIPVYEDGVAAEKAFRLSDAADLASQAQSLSSSKIADDGTQYTLLPHPSLTSANGTFRIIVADDVLVLRKGMVHTILDLWSKRFPSCPVSISTACSAEDLLRAAAMQPFDLIICDHLFNADYSKIQRLSAEELKTKCRPNVVFGGTTTSPGALRKIASEYFDTERFTVEEGDGALLGVEALTQLAEAPNPPFKTPVLLLLSGHKIEVPPSLGVIVAQKPLKQWEFVPLLEAHALFLLNAGGCVRDGGTGDEDVYLNSIHIGGIVRDSESLVNGHRSQMFVRYCDNVPK